MNVVDVVIVLLVVLSAIAGYRSGLIRSAASLLGLLLGFSVASWNYKRMAGQFTGSLHDTVFSEALAFCLIAVLVMIAVGALGYLLKTVIHAVGLGWLDRFFGLIFGLVTGTALVTLCIVVMIAFYPGSKWFEGSRLSGYFLGSVHVSAYVSPDELKRKIMDGLHLLEQDSPRWLHPSE